MDIELQNKLFEKYPRLFCQKDLDPQKTAMCWGIACGNGWYDLIDNLCATIVNRRDSVNREGNYDYERQEPRKKIEPQAVQVKAKFGGLRFYIYDSDEYIDGAISLAESMSYHICENCGSSASNPDMMIDFTLCKKCDETI